MSFGFQIGSLNFYGYSCSKWQVKWGETPRDEYTFFFILISVTQQSVLDARTDKDWKVDTCVLPILLSTCQKTTLPRQHGHIYSYHPISQDVVEFRHEWGITLFKKRKSGLASVCAETLQVIAFHCKIVFQEKIVKRNSFIQRWCWGK